MKLFFDTEFTGLHKNTTLISLGIIAENEECFYATFTDYDKSQVNDWIQENVLDKLELSADILSKYNVYEITGNKEEVKEALLDWIGTLDDTYFELVSDVCHYDMMLFIDIFGTAFDLPEYISPACYDINQDIYYVSSSMQEAFDRNREEVCLELSEHSYDEIYYGVRELLEIGENSKHNCLWDAIVIKTIYELFDYTVENLE